MNKNLKVTEVKYFKTKRGYGYGCKTNDPTVEIWNDGNGDATYLLEQDEDGHWNGNEYYSYHILVALLDDFEDNLPRCDCSESDKFGIDIPKPNKNL
jgi:hypothetical protein